MDQPSLRVLNSETTKQQDFNVPRQYVSIFRFRGSPILPPLMTPEKIMEMRQLKAKAIQIEDRIKQRKQQNSQPNSVRSHSPAVDTLDSIGSAHESSSNSNIANDIAADQQKSLTLLTRLLNTDMENDAKNASDSVCELNASANLLRSESAKNRMQKLQKSETFIYDYKTNEIIVPNKSENLMLRDINSQQMDNTKSKFNMHDLKNDKTTSPPSRLPRHVTAFSETKIPSIYVNPPTPTISSRPIYQECSGGESVINFIDPTDGECSMTFELKPSRKLSNISSGILLETTAKDSIDDGGMKPPQRSATMGSLDLSNNSQSESTLVRSNSFTVENPSQVLLDHLREQRQLSHTQPLGSYPSFSHRVTRDTVESKAKRVVKSELKLRQTPNKIQNRSSSTVSSHMGYTVGSSGSNNNNNNAYNGNNNLSKDKRSPYESKVTVNRSRPMRQLKTSSSTIMTAGKQVKPKFSMPSIPTQRRLESNIDSHTVLNRELKLSEIEVEHKERLMRLLAQQQEEQRVLENAFQTQKKMLLDGFIGAKSDNQSQIKSATTKTRPRTIARQSGSGLNSIDASPNPKSDFSDVNKSPTISLSSSVISLTMEGATPRSIVNGELSSIDVHSDFTGVTASNVKYTQSTPRRRLFSGDSGQSASNSCSTTRRFTDSEEITPTQTSTLQNEHCIRYGDGDDNKNGNVKDESNQDNPSYRDAFEPDTYEAADYAELGGLADDEDAESKLSAAAATKINACARGFLVRRLFQTEQIQRIVQTIRDTLVFVLNLHMETMNNQEESETPANIKLKARLLTQLCSASRTLHLVFFQTTIKERMEIIARDRKRIKTKLLSMNRRRSSSKIISNSEHLKAR